jgi:hypothetical protein
VLAKLLLLVKRREYSASTVLLFEASGFAIEGSSMSLSRLRIFISWAGDHAETIGKGFRDFLPDVVNAVEPFISGSDIDKGSRWGDVLAGTLQDSSCAIVCLTPESLRSIWVAFETGAVSRAAGGPDAARSRIWTYLNGLDARELQLSPFAEYQATAATEQDTCRLIRSINQLSPDAVSAETLQRRFDGVFWPQFSKVIETVQRTSPTKIGKESEPDVIPEILRTVRSIQQELKRIGRHELTAPRPPSYSMIRAGVISELASRGFPNAQIAITSDGMWVVHCNGVVLRFLSSIIEDGLISGSLNVSKITDMVINGIANTPNSDSSSTGALSADL